MSANLTDFVRQAVGTQAREQLSVILGANPEQIEMAVNAAIPTILGGLQSRASTTDTAEQLFQAFDDFDGSLHDNIDQLLSGGNHHMLLQRGSGILEWLVGSQQRSAASTIAGQTGVTAGSIQSLLCLLAPIVMSVMGKHLRSTGLDTAGLVRLLAEQPNQAAAIVPNELNAALGTGDPDGVAPAQTIAESTTGSMEDAWRGDEPASGGLVAVFLPLILLAGLSWMGYIYLGPGNQAEVEKANDTSTPPVTPSLEPLQVSAELEDVLGELVQTIRDVTDEASAQPVLTKIQAAVKFFDGLNLDQASAAEKAEVTNIVSGLVGEITSALEAAYANPGVRDVLEPAVRPLLEKLQVVAG